MAASFWRKYSPAMGSVMIGLYTCMYLMPGWELISMIIGPFSVHAASKPRKSQAPTLYEKRFIILRNSSHWGMTPSASLPLMGCSGQSTTRSR